MQNQGKGNYFDTFNRGNCSVKTQTSVYKCALNRLELACNLTKADAGSLFKGKFALV